VSDGLTLPAVLAPEDIAIVEALGPADALVAVAALNQARTARGVVEAAAAGLARGLPGRKTGVLFVDGGSQDGTLEAVGRRPRGDAAPVGSLRLGGRPGRGRALLAGLASARHLGVRAVGVVDAGLASFAPGWIEPLLGPVLHAEADYVSPVYVRALTEGTLTTNLLAPFVRALFGQRLQEILGGCAGVSAALLESLPAAEEWGDEPSGPGAEMRLLGVALAARHPIVEVQLGRKQVDPGVAPADVGHTVVDAVGPLFRLMERHAADWQDVRGSVPVPRRGQAEPEPPAGGDVRLDRMVRAFHLGLKDLLPVWEQILVDETLDLLYPLGLLAADEFRFPPPLWARVIVDFAVAHHERRLPRDHLVRALTPLYLGRVAAFVLETPGGSPSRGAEALERVCLAFEAEKAALSGRWR
jgi:hypothetical protein